MLQIREYQLFALPDMVSYFREHGLVASEPAVRDLLVVWRALDLNEPGIRDSLVRWKAVDPNIYAFPEEVLSVAKTGLTPRQQALAKEALRVARRTASRIGITTIRQTIEGLNQENPPPTGGYSSHTLEQWISRGPS